jgi:tagaturonate reductase
MNRTAETILQFGTGRFLRAFADCFLHEANRAGQNGGRVVIVQSTGDDTARLINEQKGRYHVLVRGLENGTVVDRAIEISSVSRALSAQHEWNEVLKLARSPELRIILSNTTEAGYQLDPADTPDARPPHSFPAKLLAVLRERFEADLPGLTIIPCELIEGNAALLRKELTGLCERWNLSADFRGWLSDECTWLHTLVDRIVVGPPKDHPLLAKDKLLIVAEPFAFWALEEKPGAAPFIRHPAITRTTNVEPYFLRKVRILNAAHTALCVKAQKRGFAIVRQAVEDPQLGAWLRRLLFEEIVPTLEGRVEQPMRFAEQTLERFRNPFLEHQFSDIAKNHEAKMRIRLLTTQAEHAARFGKEPPLLSEVIAEGFAGLGR